MSLRQSFLSLALNKKKLRCERFLDEMDRVIPWYRLINKTQKYYTESKIGRKRTDIKLLLKIYFLQQWYNLSDPAAEEAIYDRNSFQKYLNIDLLSDSVPDETTILNFRHLLEENNLQEKFFKIMNKVLDKHNLIIKEGTILDATIITAPSSTKNKDRKRDEEMSSTKKGNDWYFGMKAHIGVDHRSGIVHSVKTTTAKIHDKDLQNDLLHGKERSIFGDKGYCKEEDKKEMRRNGIFCGILDKAKINHPLSNKQKRRNNRLSSIRAKVEHPFQVIKCQWNYTKVRYKGLLKNTMQLYVLFGLANLYMNRKKLMRAV
jgi:transposase, IS5 family